MTKSSRLHQSRPGNLIAPALILKPMTNACVIDVESIYDACSLRIDRVQIVADEATYQGLSERARLWTIVGGALIAKLNLSAAWWFAHTTAQSFAQTEDAFEPFLMWIKESSAITLSPELRYDLIARAMHIVALGKLVANKQGIVLACFG